jgi:hypothetical protein
MWRHYLAELQCDLFGHVRSKEPYHPIKVYYIHPDGTREKVADDVCENCGHFIGAPGKLGLNKVRGE